MKHLMLIIFVYWLPPPIQANVMLEYGIDDAESLLEKNLGAATNTLQQVEGDLDFIRDQYTTTEVSILFITK